MTTETKHTPTPYNLAPRTNFYIVDGSDAEKEIMRLHGVPMRFEALSIGGGKTNHTICLVPLDESSRENAAFIVRACNAHDELVAALDDILTCEKNRRADLATLSKKPGSIYEFSDKRVQRAETALAKARGEA